MCVTTHRPSLASIHQESATVTWIIPTSPAIVVTVALADIEWIISKVLCAEIISTVRKLRIHTQLTYSHNRTDYDQHRSCRVSLELCAAPDQPMITTVQLMMMIIRTIVVMMRVFFSGAKLTFV